MTHVSTNGMADARRTVAQSADIVRNETHPLQHPYVCVVLTERQWDVVREACYSRRTKQAAAMGQRIFEQGGTSFYYVIETQDPMTTALIAGSGGQTETLGNSSPTGAES